GAVRGGLAAPALPPAAAARPVLPADPADQPPFGGGQTYQLSVPPSGAKAPPGFTLNAETVTASASEAVSGTLDDHPYRVRVRTRLGSHGQRQWQGGLFSRGCAPLAPGGVA